MTREEKELLLKDLCARLPFGVKCHFKYGTAEGDITLKCIDGNVARFDYGWYGKFHVNINPQYIKPFLRPMSSMTEEEKEELKDICTMYDCDMGSDYECFGIKIFNISRYGTAFESDYVAIDWLNRKMFDYRGLIPMDLALEAPEGMYNTKTE